MSFTSPSNNPYTNMEQGDNFEFTENDFPVLGKKGKQKLSNINQNITDNKSIHNNSQGNSNNGMQFVNNMQNGGWVQPNPMQTIQNMQTMQNVQTMNVKNMNMHNQMGIQNININHNQMRNLGQNSQQGNGNYINSYYNNNINTNTNTNTNTNNNNNSSSNNYNGNNRNNSESKINSMPFNNFNNSNVDQGKISKLQNKKKVKNDKNSSKSKKKKESSDGLRNSKYGLMGLTPVIRNMSDPHLNTLSVGTDLSTLGLQLTSQEVLYATFSYPCGETPTRTSPDYVLPRCYYKLPPVFKTSHLSKFKEQTLFYIFYNMPKDKLQAYAAKELYNRNWLFHRGFQYWFSRNTERKGSYYFWKVKEWALEEFIPKDIGEFESKLFKFEQ